MKHDATAVSGNLKDIRENRNLSLDQLSEITGVSKSMLRQIEIGKSSPTIATLWKIANGLRVSFSTLLSQRVADIAVKDFRAEKPLTAQADRYRLFPIIAYDPEHAFEIYYLEIDPDTSFDGEAHQGKVEEVIFVLEGNMQILVGEQRHEVCAKHSVRFIADCSHRYRCTGDQPVSALMMLCYLA
jgi:transcriptional regulator with XRE-family HTH domain